MSDNVRVSRSVVNERFDISPDVIAQFCRHHFRRLALFGSVLLDEFGPDSDIDVLVEFDVGCSVSRAWSMSSQKSPAAERSKYGHPRT